MKKLIFALCTICLLSSCNGMIAHFAKFITDNEVENLDGVAPADTIETSSHKDAHGSFSRIVLTGNYDVTLIQDSVTRIDFKGRKVYSDSAIVRQKAGTLYISAKEARFARGHYYIYMPYVEAITVAGAGDIEAQNFQQSSDLSIKIEGAGEVELKSSSFGNIDITADGASDIELKSVLARNINVEINGAGDADIERITADTLTVNIQGAGDLTASGYCKSFQQSVSGVGEIDTENLHVSASSVQK